MPDFHVGDKVQIVSPKARVERMAVFAISEFKEFDGELCATGDGHAWWPVEMLDYANDAPEAIELERALHDASEAKRRVTQATINALKVLPRGQVARIIGTSML